MVYDVVSPKGLRADAAVKATPPLDDLNDAVIGFLWDERFRGDEVFEILEQELSQRYPGARFVGHDVFGSTHGADESEVLAGLGGVLKQHGCNAVISAVGA